MNMEKKKIIKVLREYSENHNLQLYSLDWDDNILGMPTTIKMDKKVVGSKGKEKWHSSLRKRQTSRHSRVCFLPWYPVRNTYYVI